MPQSSPIVRSTKVVGRSPSKPTVKAEAETAEPTPATKAPGRPASAAAPSPATRGRPAPRPTAVSQTIDPLAALRVDPRGIRVPLAALLPLRIFLGITFLYAGIQKLTDPTFFQKTGIGSLYLQLTAYAHRSPLGGFITAVAIPHYHLFGMVVAWGELAIGLGTLVGVLFRPAAFFGTLLSIILWISATWDVKPYFYGSDIFAVFGWATLMLAGTGGALALDPLIGAWLQPHLRRWWGVARADSILLALHMLPVGADIDEEPVAPAKNRRHVRASLHQDRRNFLQGLAVGVASALGGVVFWRLIQPAAAPTLPVSTGTTTGAGSTTAASTAGSTTAGSSTAAAGATATPAAASGSTIATLSSLTPNSSASFTIPSNQDPGVVVRLANGNVVAFDATCTHQGCPVSYDPSYKLLLCPCHGAAFDPSQQGAVVQGPAVSPLLPVAINVNQQTGNITLQA